MTESKNQALSETEAERNLLQQHLEQIAEHQELLKQQVLELEQTEETLRELSKTTLENEILAPVANGIFIKSHLLDNKNVLVNMGAEVVCEKSIPDVLALLASQKTYLREKLEEVQELLEHLYHQIQQNKKRIIT